MELEFIKVLLQLVGAMMGLLTIVIGWIGVRIHGRLDAISASLASIERDLREDLSELDRRVTRCETRHEKDS